MFVSTSETIRINQLRIWVMDKAYDKDKPELKNNFVNFEQDSLSLKNYNVA